MHATLWKQCTAEHSLKSFELQIKQQTTFIQYPHMLFKYLSNSMNRALQWQMQITIIHYSTQFSINNNNNNNNNNNTNDNVYGAVIVTQSLREFTRFIWHTQTSARQPPILRPGQPTWAASPPVGCYMAYIHHRHFIITQHESWYSFYHPTEGGRLSQPWHTACSPI